MTQQQIAESAQWHSAIEASAAKFAESSLDFTQEQIFATQQLMNNSYALEVAKNSTSSLKLAMYNVAAVGLSLNPNLGLAYLVPRRLRKNEPPRIVLDISYRGLIAIGVDVGSIRWAKSELVYENDQFTYQGPAEKPIHICDPFSNDRGVLRGGYCIAELPSGGFLVEAMSVAEMDKIRDKSEAFKKGFGPWVEWEEQMRLKCPVKRGSKWWPPSPRLAKALQILNEDNGEGLASLADNSQTVPGPLSPPPLRQEVSLTTQNMVQQLVNRAVQTGGFEACKELLESRIKSMGELSFALNELEKAKMASVGQSQTMEQPMAVNS